jgi:hypothetical protein
MKVATAASMIPSESAIFMSNSTKDLSGVPQS